MPNQRMPGRERTRTGTVSCVLLAFWIPATTGCLASSDFELEKKSRPSNSSPTTTMVPRPPVCTEGDRSCVGKELLECVAGQWQTEMLCTAAQTCSATLERCTSCEPRIEHACEGDRLMRCRENGEDFELLEDCALAGKVCDVELSSDRCLDCRSTDRRCNETAIERCVGGQFMDAGTCPLGACRVVDGRADYCPECPRPGLEACGLGKRVKCSDSLRLEEIETCPGSCAVDGDVTRCL